MRCCSNGKAGGVPLVRELDSLSRCHTGCAGRLGFEVTFESYSVRAWVVYPQRLKKLAARAAYSASFCRRLSRLAELIGLAEVGPVVVSALIVTTCTAAGATVGEGSSGGDKEVISGLSIEGLSVSVAVGPVMPLICNTFAEWAHLALSSESSLSGEWIWIDSSFALPLPLLYDDLSLPLFTDAALALFKTCFHDSE